MIVLKLQFKSNQNYEDSQFHFVQIGLWEKKEFRYSLIRHRMGFEKGESVSDSVLAEHL